jgi:isocitrate dehydrogenase (NAD+)
MKHAVTLIEGDGIGPEISEAVVRAVEAAGVEIEWHVHEAGAAAVEQYGTQVPEVVLQSIRNDRVALKGPVTTPIGTGFRSANVTLRKELDLYACLRPVKSLPGVPSRYGDIDLVVVRENTEDLYSSLEHVVVPGVVESLKIITERASTRIAEFAFQYARRAGRRKVTAVHKANIMKLSDGLFLNCCRAVAARYPDIQYNEAIVDAACMQLVLDPGRFDVLLNENLYGDILSDLCAGLVGGLGVVPGANLGPDYAVFEAVHGSAPDIAGKNLANPTAMLLSACMMLEHLGETAAARRIRAAVEIVLRDGKRVTRDLGGSAHTTEMIDAIIDALETKVAAVA